MTIANYFLAVYYFIFGAQVNYAEFTNKTDEFFNQHIKNGQVNYSAIKTDPRKMEDLVNLISVMKTTDLNKEEKASFHINAYNILVIQSVVNNMPLKSPLDVNGFFDKQQHSIAGSKMTLNDLENDVIRKEFGDSRIHFALVCAGNGCPPLTDIVFTAENLYDRLQTLTTIAMNSSFIKVDHNKKQVLISQIFDWYQVDFGNDIEDSINYINQFRKEKIPTHYSKGYYNYDWDLNGY